MTDHGDAPYLSALERVEAMAAEAERPVPIWVRECRAKGMTEGHAKGMTEGHAKGMTEGHAKGMTEGREESLGTVRKKILQEVSSRFDSETAGNLAERLEPITDLDLLIEISWQIRDGMLGPELLAWMDARA